MSAPRNDLVCDFHNDDEPCWGQVSIRDWTVGPIQDDEPLTTCEGHSETWGWTLDMDEAREYIPQPKDTTP